MATLTPKHKPYPAYKPSGVEWLGAVPAHWEVQRIKWVAELNASRAEERACLAADTPVTFLPMERVGTEGQMDVREKVGASQVWNGYTYFRRGDILVAKITPCFENGKGAYLDSLPTEVGFGSTEFHVLRAKPTVTPQFLYRLTTDCAFRQNGTESMTGAAGQQRVPADFVANYQIPLPSLTEQTTIAAFLDRETAKIDALVSKKERLIELLQEKRTALISRAATKGLDPYAPMKDSGIEWLGDVPAHWEVRRLKTLCSMKSGDGISAISIEPVGEYPVYGGNGLRGYTSQCSHDGAFVLIGRQGALCGNVYVARGKFWATEHAVVATLAFGHEIVWFSAILTAMNLNQYSFAAAQPGLSVERIMNLHLPLPPLAEQQAIATFLGQETANLESLVAKVHEAIELLEEKRTALISAAVTGRIDVREEAECT